MSSRYAEGSQVRRGLHDDNEQRHNTGSGELCVERRKRAMPDTQHDNGRRRYENATG
jgi:hypothetical protein